MNNDDCLRISQFIKVMHRNNRDQDYYRKNKRHLAQRQEDEHQYAESNIRSKHNEIFPNRIIKNNINGQFRHDQKPDNFIPECLRNLIRPSKKPQTQRRQDYRIEKAKNQSVPVKQYIPRGGKIYQTKYQQKKKQLDQEIQYYKKKGIKPNVLQLQKLRKENYHKNSDDSDWEMNGQKCENEQKQQISSLSFSFDIPPLQKKEEVVITEQTPNYLKEVKVMDDIQEEKQVKKQENTNLQVKRVNYLKEVEQQKEIKQVKTKKADNLEKEEKKVNKQYGISKVRQTQNLIAVNQQNKPKIVINCASAKKQELKQQVKVLAQLIDAIDLDEQKNQKDCMNKEQHPEQIYKELQQKQQEKIKANKELIIRLIESHKKAKIYLSFQAIQNIQSFTIKEVELTQLGLPIKLDSNGRPKINQSYNIPTQQFAQYIKFIKTSHYFPKIGRFQQQVQHFVDVAENRELMFDQTNQVEFQFSQIKVSDLQFLEQNKNNKSVISVKIVSLLCMICGSKNQVVVLQNDMTAMCSCKGNDCSQKIFGKFSNMRMEIIKS